MGLRFACALLLALVASACNATIPVSQNHPSSGNRQQNAAAQQYGYIPPPQARFNTSHWRVYSDDRISFRYPANWTASTQAAYGNEHFTISLQPPKPLSDEGTLIPPLSVSYEEDRFGGSISRLYTNPLVQQTIQKQHQLIGDKDAFVLQGPLPPGNEDSRIVFTKSEMFVFDSLARSLPISVPQQREILNVFETILATTEFK